MKILKLLNNNYLSILLIIFLIVFNVKAEDEPIDIWNIDKNKIKETQPDDNQNILENNNTQVSEPSIYDLQSKKENDTVQISSSLNSQEIKIVGLMIQRTMILKLIYGQIQMVINLNIFFQTCKN